MARAWTALSVAALLAAPALGCGDQQASERAALGRGVAYLERAQLATGEFNVWACSDQALTACQADNEPLATGIILRAIASVPQAAALCARAARFLEQAQDPDGLYRYYQREHPLYDKQPALLEDTVANLTALEAAGHKAPDFSGLLLAYQTEAGPFHLYAIPLEELRQLQADPQRAAQRMDQAFAQFIATVEPVANAKIQAYLARHGRSSASLCAYLLGVVKQGLEPGRYSVFYPSPYAYLAAFSEAYADGARCLAPGVPAVETRLVQAQHEDGSWGSVVETAWAGTALLRLGHRGPALARAAAWLARQQRADGSWPREAYWSVAQPLRWYGSEEVTTGLVLDFLARKLARP